MIEGEQMSFWDLPDKDETAANVDAFLKGQINRLARQAGCKLTDIASPDFSNPSVTRSRSNNVEEKIYKGLHAIEALQAIRYTMDKTYGLSPQILIKYYIQHKPVHAINRELLIDHDSFRKLKTKALCEFADCWNSTQEVFEWDDEDKLDLQVY